ncbi:hypothetical protein D3C86_1967580 [compost metagenome]
MPAPTGLPDPAAQDAQRAALAAAQKESPANLTGAGVDKLVDIGSKQLAVQEKMLMALQNIMQQGTQRPGQTVAPRMAGPMSVKAPTSA